MDESPLDLGALRSGPADVDRVVGAAMRRIRARPRRTMTAQASAWARPVMAAAAALSLAAMLVLAMAGPRRDVPSAADLFSERYAAGGR